MPTDLNLQFAGQVYTFDLSCPTSRLLAADAMEEHWPERTLQMNFLRSGLPLYVSKNEPRPVLRPHYEGVGFAGTYGNRVAETRWSFRWGPLTVGAVRLNHQNRMQTLSWSTYTPRTHRVLNTFHCREFCRIIMQESGKSLRELMKKQNEAWKSVEKAMKTMEEGYRTRGRSPFNLDEVMK